MKPNKRALVRTIILVTFTVLILCVFSPITIYDGTQVETKGSTNLPEDITEIEPEPVLSPDRDAIPAEVTWNLVAANTLASAPWGSADYPSGLDADDGTICRMSEEWDGANYRFDLRFRTSAIYAHRYLNHELRMDFTQIWSLTPEDLKFYVALGTASGAEGYYTYVGQLSGPGSYTFTLDRAILFNPTVTSTRFVYVRILGAIESSDPFNGNIWDFDFLQIAYKDFAPRLIRADVDKIEDDVIYARLGASGNNYATITIEAECWDGSAEWEYITLRYEQGSNYWQAGWDWFTIPYGQPAITFSGNVDWVSFIDGTFSFTSNTIIVTWNIKFNWNHPSELGMDLTLSTFAISVFSSADPTIVTLPWHIETRLDMAISPSIEESRVGTGETCSYSGDVEYHGSSGHWSPLSSEVDIQVQRVSPSPTGWIYSAQPASDGTFTVNPCTASTSEINTFRLRVVADGTTTNLLTSTYSDTVIGDRVVVSSGTIGSDNYNPAYGGGVRNTGQSDTLYLGLQWESSGTAITSGTVSWSSSGDMVSMSYASGRWEGDTYARSSVGELTYNDLTVIVDGATYDVVTEPSYSVLWDEIVILTTVIEGGDNYVNIGNSVTIRVTAQLSHLGYALDSGLDTLYMNGVKMSNGGTYFTYTLSHSYPGLWTYSVDDLNAIENTYGITKIATGKPSVSCTWDTFSVDLSVDDAHVSIGDTIRVWAHVTRAYDGSVFTDGMGSVVLRHTTSGDISMTYSSGDGLWYTDVVQNSVNQWIYFVYSITDNIEQISTVGRGLSFDGINDYVDCGADSSLDLTSALTLSTWFYGDGSNWGSGMYLLAKKDNNNAQYALYVHSDGTLRFAYYNVVLREIDLEPAVTRNTWHHVVVTISGTTLNCWFDGIRVQKNITLPAALTSFVSVPLYLGAQKSGASTGYHLEGFISEVQIYDIVLSEAECKALYRGEYPDDIDMKLNLGRASVDVSAGFWNDFSGTGNNGAIYGAVVTVGTLPMSDDEVVGIIWDGVIIAITGPTYRTLPLGENASGIVVTAYYAYKVLPFDGIIHLNNTQFSYLTPGQRGYTVSTVSDSSCGITFIMQNDETYAIWVLQQAIIHLDSLAASILVSTIYDPRHFSVDVYLTDTNLNLIPGWVNLTICAEYFAVYCNGIANSAFNYTPVLSGVHTLEAIFEGDSNYDSAETSILLTATPRDIVFTTALPTDMISTTPTLFGFLHVYDNDFQGSFQGVTYVRNFPINASFSIWWTISSDYGEPRIFTGSWTITTGQGTGSVTVPWDLDGNSLLTSTDFICYFVIHLDGLGIYENITIETPVNVLQPLQVSLQVPALTYSDQSTLSLQLHPLYDSSFTENLDLTIALYVSDDNATWVFIGETTTTLSGWQSIDWTCTDSGMLFFKAETMTTEFYAGSVGYANSVAGKESTVLTIEHVGNFTYSDQGVLVAWLSTDDGEPLSDYSVYLEIMDGTWVSIGSGLTNVSGHASILWTPLLPAGNYSIQLRVSLTGSQYYLSPNNAVGQLVVSKELIVVSIDSTTAAQGYVRARVTDNDYNPVAGIQVHFYAGSNREYLGARITDNDGYTRLNITLSDGELLEAVVNEDDFYYGAVQEVAVAMPPDLMVLGGIIGAVFVVAAGIAVGRKIIRGRAVSSPPSVPPEVSRALEEERDSIPERVREHSERRIAELDKMSRDGGARSEAHSLGELDEVSKTDDKVEWELDP